MKVIVTGATGMVGKGVLLECLDHPDVLEVLSIGRNPLRMDHAKLKEVIHADFSDFSPIKEELRGYDACFHCMGVTSVGKKEEEYRKLTYDYTMALARLLHNLNRDIVFNYVSGVGTDSSEKGKIMWARVKGKTENDLLGLGFKAAYMFRPGIIIPLKGIKSKTRMANVFYGSFMWLIKIIKFFSPKSIVNTTQVGLAMINSVRVGYEKNVLEPEDIQKLADSRKT